MYYFGTLRIFTSTAVGLDHFSIDEGGKIVLPPSVLADISDMVGDSPIMFSISHPVTEVLTHCGVIEFSAEEGSVVAPSWVLDQIGVMAGDIVYIETVFLPVGSYARFKPMSTDFLDITDQKAVLENHLRGFTCLTTGDTVPIHYNNNVYQLKVAETRPGDAICIINCDLEVEFEAPVGYVSPRRLSESENKEQPKEDQSPPVTPPDEMVPFSGQGYRLDGKAPKLPQPSTYTPRQRGIPDYDWQFGTLTFSREIPSPKTNGCPEPNGSTSEFSPFSGSGRSLK